MTMVWWLCRWLWLKGVAADLKVCKRGLRVHYGGCLCRRRTGEGIERDGRWCCWRKRWAWVEGRRGRVVGDGADCVKYCAE